MEKQTKEMVEAACRACEKYEGLNPLNLKVYIREDLQNSIDTYRGHWELDRNHVWYWYND